MKIGRRRSFTSNYWFQRKNADGSIESSGRFSQKLYIISVKARTVVKFSASPAGVRKRDDPSRDLESAETMLAVALEIHRTISR